MMMSSISRTYKKILKKNGKAFIPYIMAGCPNMQRTSEIIRLLEECGADMIELGVPFSDPLADGPTIQKASQRALEQGVTLSTVISFVRDLRNQTQIPLILMTYYNPVSRYGDGRFVADASAAGVNGVIIPDLPPDEASDLIRRSKTAGFDTIFLLAPTSTEDRIKKVAKATTGFIYYVSITGITGSRLSLDPAIADHINNIRRFSDKPISIGFGIATPEEASTVAQLADGVIVGSAIVKRVEDSDEHLREYILSLRKAIQ
jgi:tryptophan synthase alpha chain